MLCVCCFKLTIYQQGHFYGHSHRQSEHSCIVTLSLSLSLTINPSGWCTYYTCLKRLSTFFSIVAMGTDYCLWMTGSPPSHLRFHLLNAGVEDAISLCIWFKDTHRKDVYKVRRATLVHNYMIVELDYRQQRSHASHRMSNS